MNNNADIHLLYNIIENILKSSDSPNDLGNYLSEQIKSLIGLKVAAVYSIDEINNHLSLMGICPNRKKEQVQTPGFLDFIKNFTNIKSYTIIGLDDKEQYKEELSSLKFSNIIIIPLSLQEKLEGLIILIDIFDAHNIDNILSAFNKITGLAAVIIRNSKLFNNLEIIVEERTKEIQAKNEEYETLNEELKHSNSNLLKAKKEAEESEERYKALHNASFGGIAIHDNGIILDCNNSLIELTGFSYNELIGMNGLLLIAENARNLVKEKIASGDTEAYEAIGVRKDGTTYPLRLEARNIPYKGKTVRSVEFRDITQQKSYENELKIHRENLEHLVQERTNELIAINEELSSTNEELYAQRDSLEETIKQLNQTQAQLVQSEKMAALGTLVAGVAHEINNPVNFINSSLTGLKNNLDYLSDYVNFYHNLNRENFEAITKAIAEKDATLPDVFNMFRKSIEIIEIGVKRTTKIVKGLKSFARAGEDELEKYDIHENLENTLLILYNQYKNNIQLTKNYGQIPTIKCYPGQINQVLMNLLINAIQAIEKKGKITITTGIETTENVFVEINDTGKGIPKNKISSIFDPFFTTKKVGEGTGLGLSISYNIIKKHYGNITVKSDPGKGSTFKIILPVNHPK